MKKLIVTLVITSILAMVTGTIVEHLQGTNHAHQYIYGAPWFVALWTILMVCTTIVLQSKSMRKRLTLYMTHMGMVLVMVGGGITWLTSNEGYMHIRQGDMSMHFVSKDKMLHRLPFALELDSFEVRYYPYTTSPADYVSHLVVHQDQDTTHATISMNNILRSSGYRIYQASYDADLRGTVLTVSYDPIGTYLVHIGFIITTLGMIIYLCLRRESFIKLIARTNDLSKRLPVSIIAFCLLCSASARNVPTINRDRADSLSRVMVVYNGRVTPMYCAAHDILRTVYGATDYHGLNPVQVSIGMMHAPRDWASEPIIKIDDAASDYLGFDSLTYVSPAQLVSPNVYKKLVAPLDGLDKSTRESIIKADQSLGLVMSLMRHELISEVPDSVNATWQKERIEAEILLASAPWSLYIAIVCIMMGMIGYITWLRVICQRNRAHNGVSSLLTNRWLSVTITAILAVLYVLRWYVAGRIPMSNGYETMLTMALCVLVISIFTSRRLMMATPAGYIIAGFCLLVAHIGEKSSAVTNLMPVLRSPLLSIHVSMIMVSYALLAFCAMTGLTGLIVRLLHRSRGKEIMGMMALMARTLLYPAVFLLLIGIFLGSVWADVSWGKYWSWDPKEVWALISVFVYAIPLHRSLKVFSNDLFFCVYVLLAFLSVLMTYFGVNYLLGGMHSYA